jgi:hypothetical protein
LAGISGRPSGSHTGSRGSASASCRPLGARQGRLAAEEGIFAGASSGANVVAALRVAERLGVGHTVATIMVDSGLRYLSTELYAPQHNGLE